MGRTSLAMVLGGRGMGTKKKDGPRGSTIAQVKTKTFQRGGKPFNTIMIPRDHHALPPAPVFANEVNARFMAERMAGPADTGGLLVTIIGDMTSQQFADLWRAHVQKDQALRFFM